MCLRLHGPLPDSDLWDVITLRIINHGMDFSPPSFSTKLTFSVSLCVNGDRLLQLIDNITGKVPFNSRGSLVGSGRLPKEMTCISDWKQEKKILVISLSYLQSWIFLFPIKLQLFMNYES